MGQEDTSTKTKMVQWTIRIMIERPGVRTDPIQARAENYLALRQSVEYYKRNNLPIPEQFIEQILRDDRWLAENVPWFKSNYGHQKP